MKQPSVVVPREERDLCLHRPLSGAQSRNVMWRRYGVTRADYDAGKQCGPRVRVCEEVLWKERTRRLSRAGRGM